MYSLQEIKSALDRETLSDALYKMERFARANSVNDLADWCKLELHGYDPVHKEERERVTELRSVAVQWRDVFNHPVIIDPQLSFFSTLPIWAGVSELEPYTETGVGWLFPAAIEVINKYSTGTVASAWIPPEHIQSLLKRIRLKARSKFDDNIPSLSNRSLLPIISPIQRWTWQKRSTTFFGIFAGIWLLLEPFFAVFGGNGPLSSWGLWRYPTLVFAAVLLTPLMEYVEYRQRKKSE